MVRPLVPPSAREHESISAETNVINVFVHVSGGLRVWIKVGCPCPPVRNDIVTPDYLFFLLTSFFTFFFGILPKSDAITERAFSESNRSSIIMKNEQIKAQLREAD